MKRHLTASSLLLISVQLCLFAADTAPEPRLSDSEAATIVAAEEQAREAAKDAKEAELQSADITRTVTLKQGDKTIVFNLVKPSPKTDSTRDQKAVEPEIAIPLERRSFIEPEKAHVTLTLHGNVDEDGISEIWWNHEGQPHRIFCNLDFRVLGGISNFSDETHRYSVFSLIFGGTRGNPDYWYPKPSDFSKNTLEYFVAEGGEDTAAYGGVTAMMLYYLDHQESLLTEFHNKQKLDKAREEYLKLNPPKKRAIILNYTNN